LAERVDSIHIKIKIDVDPADKEFIENLSSDLAQADEQKTIQKQSQREVTTDDEQTNRDIY